MTQGESVARLRHVVWKEGGLMHLVSKVLPVDGELILRHRAGDRSAFPELVNLFRKRVYSYIVRSGIDRASCDDIFQEVFLRVHSASASFDASRRLAPWLLADSGSRGNTRPSVATATAPSSYRITQETIDAPAGGPKGSTEGYSDLLTYVKGDLQNLTNVAREHSERLERTERDAKAQEEKTTGVIEMVVQKLEGLDEQIRTESKIRENGPIILESRKEGFKRTYPAVAYTGSRVGNERQAPAPEPTALESYAFDVNTVPPPPPPPPQLEKRSFISPGDSVRLKLLTGVIAPIDGTPYPVVFKLNGPIQGPDGSSIDLGEARLIASAQGSETDGRVIYRMTDLAFRHPDGRRSVVKVDGWIVGEGGVVILPGGLSGRGPINC